MTNEVRCWCRHCKAELPPDHAGPCPKCGKNGKRCEATAIVSVVPRASLRARLKRKGFNKFAKEILQGWFRSRNPELRNGVYKERVIDREKDEYHETVKDASTGEVIREEHEPLSQHKPNSTRQGRNSMKYLLWAALIIVIIIIINELFWLGRSELAWVILGLAIAVGLQVVYLLRKK